MADNEMALIPDTPEEDKIQFGFENQAEVVAGLLLDKPPNPFAIAIDGEWGSGKTTLPTENQEDPERQGRVP